MAAALAGLEAGAWLSPQARCQTLLDHDPDDIHASLLLGLAIAGMGQPGRAAPVLDRVARRRPDHAHPCTDFATLCAPPSAAALYRACMRLAPDNARLRRDFASFLLENDGAMEAEQVLLDAPDGTPDTAAARHLMGLALTEQARFAAAIQQFRTAILLDPVPSMAWANLGMVLKIERRFDAALEAYDQAIARSPRDASIRVNRMVALLHAGRWTEAWHDGDWRLRLPGYHGLPVAGLLPDLETLGDLRGRTVLVTHEEGFGDTLQFLRYVPLLAARGARVLAQVPMTLTRLARGVAGVADVLPEGASPPHYDYHCPVVSLPRAFGTTPATIPAERYLWADPIEAARWDARLPRGGLRVGLVWAGQARPWLPGFTVLDARRSAGSAVFSPLGAVAGVTFISLQMGEAAALPPPGMRLTNPMSDVRDFADTAAIVANLDLVISVDTSVVHLAGAMGKPVFMLDRYDNCWRWLSGRADSPWYPALTIFRQEQPGDWSAPIKRLTAALAGLVAFRGMTATDVHPSPVRECSDAA